MLSSCATGVWMGTERKWATWSRKHSESINTSEIVVWRQRYKTGA